MRENVKKMKKSNYLLVVLVMVVKYRNYNEHTQGEKK